VATGEPTWTSRRASRRLGWLAQGIQLGLQGRDIRRHRLAQQFTLDRIHTLGPSRERHLAQSLIFASLNAMASLGDGLFVDSDQRLLLPHHRRQRV
jgi:hypothetical protein